MTAAVFFAAAALFYTAFGAFAMARGFNLPLIILNIIMSILCMVLSFGLFLWGVSLVIVAQGRGASEADRGRAAGSS